MKGNPALEKISYVSSSVCARTRPRLKVETGKGSRVWIFLSLSAFLRACSVNFCQAATGFPLVLREGGMRRRVETDGESRMERGVDSILRLFRFFSPPRLAPHQATFFFFFFFFQLFNDERASRRRCCLSSAAHKSCAKLARRTPSAFFSSPLYVYDSGNPRYLGKLRSRKAGPVNFNYRLSISFHGQLYDSFPRA